MDSQMSEETHYEEARFDFGRATSGVEDSQSDIDKYLFIFKISRTMVWVAQTKKERKILSLNSLIIIDIYGREYLRTGFYPTMSVETFFIQVYANGDQPS